MSNTFGNRTPTISPDRKVIRASDSPNIHQTSDVVRSVTLTHGDSADKTNEECASLRFDGRELELLNKIVSGSSLHFLSSFNELQDNTYYDWDDIFKAIGVQDHTDTDRDIIASILKGDSGCNASNIMTQSSINGLRSLTKSLYQDLQYDFYDLFRRSVVVPTIVYTSRLSFIYEQLVFYEYIYKSPVYSLYHKMRWIVDKGFYALISILSDCLLDTIDVDRHGYEGVHELYWVTLVEYFYDDTAKYDAYVTLMELHNRILPFDIRKLSGADSFSFYNKIMANDTFENWNYLVNNFSTENPGFFNKIDAYTLHSKIYSHYRDRALPGVNWSFDQLFYGDITKVINRACSRQVRQTLSERIAKFYLIDLLMQLLESNHTCITRLSDKTKETIAYAWLSAANTVINNSNLSYSKIHDVPNFYLVKQYTRHLRMSPALIDIFGKIRTSLDELSYVYMSDNLELFTALTANCHFNVLCPVMIEYAPMKIINHIITEHYDSDTSAFMRKVGHLSLDLYKLCRTDSAQDFLNICAKSEITIEIGSLVETDLTHLENEYVIMEHRLNSFDQRILAGALTILETIDYKRFSNSHIVATMIHASTEIFQSYMHHMITDRKFRRYGPELGEIWWEFSLMRLHETCAERIKTVITDRNDYVMTLGDEDLIDLREYQSRAIEHPDYDFDDTRDLDEDDETNSDAEIEIEHSYTHLRSGTEPSDKYSDDDDSNSDSDDSSLDYE